MTEDREQLEALLADYIDGNLDAHSQKQVEAYLAANPEMRAFVERAVADSESLRGLPRVNAPVDFAEEFRGQVERDLLLGAAGDTYMPRRRFAGPVFGAAAMLIIGLGIAGGAYWLLAKRPTPFIDVAFKDSPAMPSQTATDTAKPADAKADNARVEEDLQQMRRAIDDELLKRPLTPPKQPLVVTDRDESGEARRAEADQAVAGTTSTTPSPTPPGDAEEPTLSMAAPAITPSNSATPPSPPAAIAGASTDARTRSTTGSLLGLAEAEPIAPPSEVREALGVQLNPLRKSVVLVVEADTASAATAVDQQLTAQSSIERAGALAEAKDEQASDRASRVPAVISNVDASPTSQAIQSSRLFVARGVSAVQAQELDETLQQLPVGVRYMRYVTTAAKEKVDTSATLDGGVITKTAGPATTQAAATTQRVSVEPPLIDRPLAKGDRIVITLTDPDAFNLKSQYALTVDEAGTVELPSLAGVIAAGKTKASLRQEIVSAYQSKKLMRDPIVTVRRADEPEPETAMTKISGEMVPSEKKDMADEPVDVLVLVRSGGSDEPTNDTPGRANHAAIARHPVGSERSGDDRSPINIDKRPPA